MDRFEQNHQNFLESYKSFQKAFEENEGKELPQRKMAIYLGCSQSTISKAFFLEGIKGYLNLKRMEELALSMCQLYESYSFLKAKGSNQVGYFMDVGDVSFPIIEQAISSNIKLELFENFIQECTEIILITDVIEKQHRFLRQITLLYQQNFEPKYNPYLPLEVLQLSVVAILIYHKLPIEKTDPVLTLIEEVQKNCSQEKWFFEQKYYQLFVSALLNNKALLYYRRLKTLNGQSNLSSVGGVLELFFQSLEISFLLLAWQNALIVLDKLSKEENIDKIRNRIVYVIGLVIERYDKNPKLWPEVFQEYLKDNKNIPNLKTFIVKNKIDSFENLQSYLKCLNPI